MWLFTEFGFYSVVAGRSEGKGPKKDVLLVRSREKQDLLNFGRVVGWSPEATEKAILETRGNDYQWRIIADRGIVARFQEATLGALDYHNFKGVIAQTADQKHKGHALHQVWDAMAALQPCRPYSSVLRSEEKAFLLSDDDDLDRPLF